MGTVHRPYARVRLRKVIVTREVTLTVQLRHEEFRLDRQPPPNDGHDSPDPPGGDDGLVHEFVLHEEVPIVEVQVRPVERVRVERVRHDGETTVSATVGTERVDVVRVDPVSAPEPGTHPHR